MGRKKLFALRAVVRNGVVALTAYKSAQFHRNRSRGEDFRTLRVWRKTVTDFDFSLDYAEYFDGLSHEDAALVFEGHVEPSNERKFTCVDGDVKPGEIYAYWMAAAEGEPTGPVGVAVRDPEVWWSEESLSIGIEDLRNRYPKQVSVETVGRTVRGRSLEALHIGRGKASAAFVGVVHAGESGPELMLPAFEVLLQEHGDLLDQVAIDALPVLNLDERQRQVEGVPWYLRANANGVDLNRNFPADWDRVDHRYGFSSSDGDSMSYRGPRPASEPETRAAMRFLEARRPVAVFAFHALAGLCGPKFMAAQCAERDDAYVVQCRAFAETYASGMGASFSEGHTMKFTCSPGSLPAWCYRELKTPAFDLEMVRDDEGYAQCVSGRTDPPLLQTYRRRHIVGMRQVLEGVAG